MKSKAKEDPEAIDALRGEMRAVSQEIKEKEARLKEVEEELEAHPARSSPTCPTSRCPWAPAEQDNVVVRTWGEKPTFLFTPKQHFELGEKLGLLDFERAAKVSGSRFAFYKGGAGAAGAGAGHLHDRRAHRRRATRSCCRPTW